MKEEACSAADKTPSARNAPSPLELVQERKGIAVAERVVEATEDVHLHTKDTERFTTCCIKHAPHLPTARPLHPSKQDFPFKELLCSSDFCSEPFHTLTTTHSTGPDELADEDRAILWPSWNKALAEGRSKEDKPNKSLFCRAARFGSVHAGLTASPCK